MIKNVTSQSFENEVLKSDRPVLADFFATWCAPCKMLAPIIDEIGNELEKTLDIAKVNIDMDAEIAEYYSVSSVPTLILFKNGSEMVRFTGVMPKDSLVGAIMEYVNEYA